MAPLQIVKVAGCNMWVMEETETDDLSRDPPQVGYPWQKVHAQQLPASSSKTIAVPQRVTGTLVLLSQCVTYRGLSQSFLSGIVN